MCKTVVTEGVRVFFGRWISVRWHRLDRYTLQNGMEPGHRINVQRLRFKIRPIRTCPYVDDPMVSTRSGRGGAISLIYTVHLKSDGSRPSPQTIPTAAAQSLARRRPGPEVQSTPSGGHFLFRPSYMIPHIRRMQWTVKYLRICHRQT
jgi:hypothetical protein